jgi:hypothetical protein
VSLGPRELCRCIHVKRALSQMPTGTAAMLSLSAGGRACSLRRLIRRLVGVSSVAGQSAFCGIMAPVKKVMTQPISVIFRFLQNKQRLQIWLYENTGVR